MFRRYRGFTLIELLIVVAIIAILAAIAVPNFLEAQVRAKVTRGKNDMRALATALEAYKIDENKYPPDFQFYQGWMTPPAKLNDRFAYCCLGRLTTPVAYMSSLPKNVFTYTKGWFDGDPQWYGYKSEQDWRTIQMTFTYQNNPLADKSKLWALISVGPDQTSSGGEYAIFGERIINALGGPTTAAGNGPAVYDPTNGTMSIGDIVRVGP